MTRHHQAVIPTKVRMFAFGAALASVLSSPALAADSRVRTLFYDPTAIVPVTGRTGIQSTIEFGPDERIENVAIGDSAAWQVTPNRRASLLFLKPVAAKGRTNMTVVTDKRTYMFDLVAQPKGGTPLYALRFTYPEPILPPQPIAKASPIPVSIQAASPTGLHFDWARNGTKRLLPDRIFDDGEALFLKWSNSADVPAMLAVGPDGSEGPVNFVVKDDYVVIDSVPARLVLRSGRETASIERIAARQTPKSAER